MIVVKLNQPQFEYDIHSLVKAFYPAKEVKVVVEGNPDTTSLLALSKAKVGEEAALGLSEAESALLQSESDTEISSDIPDIRVFLEEDRIFCRLEGRDRISGDQIILEQGETSSPEEERSSKKSKLKKLLYGILSSYTGQKLPWGNLTGIRPTKIAYGLLEEGKSREEIIDHMQKAYDTSREKAILSVDIAEREQGILSGLSGERGFSLYVGIPFCPTTCLYCSFTSYPIRQWKKRVSDYLTALEKEMDAMAEVFTGKVLDTVYIGGGTPTTLEPEEFVRLFTALQKKFDFSRVQEFTVEAGRADSITREKLQVMKDFGVTRVSVNPQTMKEETLKLIGRQHTVEQVKEAFQLVREVGIPNINMDLILGLPEESIEDVANTMEEVKKLAPDSLTVHSLAIKRASKMSQWTRENGTDSLQNTEETMETAARGAEAMGMKPYYLYRQKNIAGNLENVGYATKGNYGIYNILIMEEKQTIAALGAGTISKRVYPDGRIERCDAVKDVELYMQRIEEMIERKKVLFMDI
ncbi:MAG: coproporphyrinogen dehydrogenase HemZ [Lachnospiraceae bacterium]|nr:coproporphyrinogen dehydrogenase HemZ [Lachnospiraceae bacterium]